jgi:hypothetical protein
MLLLPNARMEAKWTNNNRFYGVFPLLTFFGYRLRIEDARILLSTIVG